MKKIMLFAAFAAALFADKSNGINIQVVETTEGVTVFVTPSSCNVDMIAVRLVASQVGEGFKTYNSDPKRVGRCDQRAVEFRFAKPGTISFIGVDEATITNTGSAK